MNLYHFSEQSDIELFKPRVKENRQDMPPVVWAIDQEHEFTFYFPRECPRIIYKRFDTISDADLSKFFGLSYAEIIITVETHWFELIQRTTLYRYTLPGEDFTMFDATAGYYVSESTIKPIKVDRLTNLIEKIIELNIEIRFTPNLHPLRNAILNSTVKDFGIHRFHNAKASNEMNKTMTNQAVIFDLDNTLLDRSKSLETFSRKFHSNFVNSDYSIEQLALDIINADGDGYQDKADIYNLLLKKLPWRSTPTITEFKEYWDLEFPNSSELMNQALEVLEHFKKLGFKLGLITNGKSEVQNSKIDAVNIRALFDIIHISEEVGYKKPDQAIFQMTASKLDCIESECYYIGDHPLNDVYGAANAGLNAIWFEGYCAWDPKIQINKYQTIQRLEDLLHIISYK